MAKVLVIDDTPSEQDYLSLLLEQQGHDVIVADNGADGIAVCLDEIPDAVLIDIVMPEINGFQAARQLTYNKKTTHIPIIIVSHSLQEADEVWGIKQGASAFLTKPVTEKKIIAGSGKGFCCRAGLMLIRPLWGRGLF